VAYVAFFYLLANSKQAMRLVHVGLRMARCEWLAGQIPSPCPEYVGPRALIGPSAG